MHFFLLRSSPIFASQWTFSHSQERSKTDTQFEQQLAPYAGTNKDKWADKISKNSSWQIYYHTQQASTMTKVKYPIFAQHQVQSKVSNLNQFHCHCSVLQMSFRIMPDNTETAADFPVLLHLHRPSRVEEEEHQAVFAFSQFHVDDVLNSRTRTHIRTCRSL